ncbi:MAG: methyltransferase domain-containing protein [Gammaproteobacteria bacterium]
MHKEKIQQCFDKSYNTYDQYSYPQQMIGSHLIEKLVNFEKSANSIIDLGCGTGLVTKNLADLFAYQDFTAIDLSDALISKARDRFQSYKITCLQQDFEDINLPASSQDLVFSNMALHWSSDFSKMFYSINKMLKTGGLIAFTIPTQGTFQELQGSKNDFLNIPDVISKINAACFDIIECSEGNLKIGFNDWKSALKSIKATGANYLFNKERRSLRKVLSFPGNPSLTYVTGYFIARKLSNVS